MSLELTSVPLALMAGVLTSVPLALMAGVLTSIPLALVADVLSILSPYVWPLVPVVMSSTATSGRSRHAGTGA